VLPKTIKLVHYSSSFEIVLHAVLSSLN